jgi:hypothetical protein
MLLTKKDWVHVISGWRAYIYQWAGPAAMLLLYSFQNLCGVFHCDERMAIAPVNNSVSKRA